MYGCTPYEKNTEGSGHYRGGNRGLFAARMLRNYQLPAAEASGLVDKLKEVKPTPDGSYGGELTEDGVKEILSRGRGGRGGGANAPAVSGAKGSVRFWLKDGLLHKYEYQVQGTMTIGQNQREIEVNRTMTVEIKGVDGTKVDVPEDARKKLS